MGTIYQGQQEMNGQMITIDDLCNGIEEAVIEIERSKDLEKVGLFVASIKEEFNKAYTDYKTVSNANSRSPQTRIFKDWLARSRNIFYNMPHPYRSWVRSHSTGYDQQTKEIYYIVRLIDGNVLDRNITIRTRTWTYTFN
jgi:hypothetical protein